MGGLGFCSQILGYGSLYHVSHFSRPHQKKWPSAESSSTSVTVASPTLSSTDLMTLPVAGSLTVRTCARHISLSPTLTPALLPTLIMSVLPLASATKPEWRSRGGSWPLLRPVCSPVSVDRLVHGFTKNRVGKIAAAHVQTAGSAARPATTTAPTSDVCALWILQGR